MEYSLEELKAMAYDRLAQIEQSQGQVRELNAMIANYKEPEKKEAKDAKVS